MFSHGFTKGSRHLVMVIDQAGTSTNGSKGRKVGALVELSREILGSAHESLMSIPVHGFSARAIWSIWGGGGG